jgi:hypothetical protein
MWHGAFSSVVSGPLPTLHIYSIDPVCDVQPDLAIADYLSIRLASGEVLHIGLDVVADGMKKHEAQ